MNAATGTVANRGIPTALASTRYFRDLQKTSAPLKNSRSPPHLSGVHPRLPLEQALATDRLTIRRRGLRDIGFPLFFWHNGKVPTTVHSRPSSILVMAVTSPSPPEKLSILTKYLPTKSNAPVRRRIGPCGVVNITFCGLSHVCPASHRCTASKPPPIA